LEGSGGEVGGSGRVAASATDHEFASGVASSCYLADVVGGQVGRGVGGAAFPAGAPVAHDPAVVGDRSASAFAFLGVVVEVGAT
jgi:hypothetical protein